MKPKLRFSNFINDYEIKDVSDITSNISSGKISKQLEDGEYNVYGSMGIIGKSNFYDYAGEKVLVARVGANAGSVNKINEKCCISDNTLVLEPKDILNDYLYYALSHYNPKKLIFGSGQPLVTGGQLKKIKLGIPSKEEQLKVSNFLSLLDKKIELQSKKIEDLKLFKKGLSNKIFSTLDVVKEEKLGNICNITTGKLDANAMVENGQYRFYTCAKDYYYIDKYAFDTEALLISGNGAYVGYIHYYKGKFNAYQRTYVLDKFTENIQYIKVYLDEFLSKRINSEKKEGNTPYIVLSTLSDMMIKLTNVTDENKVINTFNNINNKIDKEELKLNKLIELKKGLMQYMFV